MKLKEWGLMRHKPRKTSAKRNGEKVQSATPPLQDEDEQGERDSSAAVESMEVDLDSVQPTLEENFPVDAGTSERCAKSVGWQVVSDPTAEPSFMGLLHRTPE
jgi:hypothetical protein